MTRVIWRLRRDLRLADNLTLHQALRALLRYRRTS
jgi:hypothetical protein